MYEQGSMRSTGAGVAKPLKDLEQLTGLKAHRNGEVVGRMELSPISGVPESQNSTKDPCHCAASLGGVVMLVCPM